MADTAHTQKSSARRGQGRWVRLALAAGLLVGVIGASASGPLRGTVAQAQASAAGTVERFGLTSALPSSPGEVSRLQQGLAAADSGAWDSVRSLASISSDPLVRRILTWRLVSDPNGNASFDELSAAMRDMPDWPRQNDIRARAEAAISGSSLTARERIDWFTANPPQSGDGQAALAYALQQAGRASEGRELARRTWRERSLSERQRFVLETAFASALTAEDHADRVALVLWLDRVSEARALLPKLSAADRAVANARIALKTNPRRGLQAAVDAVPQSRQADPGFLYDRTRYVRRSGRPEDAVAHAVRIDATAAPVAARDDIHDEKRLYVPRLLRAGQARQAYRMISAHGLTSGARFADAEFLSGWISLRYLNDVPQAQRHFQTLNAGVSTPVSKARALYWLAEASERLGQGADAANYRQQAAQLSYTFYGQLAAEKLGGAVLDFPQGAPVDPAIRSRFEQRELVQALRLMAALGDRTDFETFAFHLDDQIDTREEHELLAQMARSNGFARTGVRSAKAGMARGILAPEAAYPLISLPDGVRQPEPALIHAIIRQETEFDQRAVSSAGARGLMQLMPATARITARLQGLAYSPTGLLDDPSYNITLGSAYLQQMIGQWNGSYVLAVASYNAGPGRAQEWITANGDPRTGAIDVVDWIELIPFEETRNYVHRVLENTTVYRRRLADGPTPIRLSQDLRRGG